MSREMVADKRRPLRSSSLTETTLQRKCACGPHSAAGGECSECREERVSLQRNSMERPALLQRCAGRTCPPGTCNHDESSRLQRRANESATVPPIVHEVLRSPGQPLDADTRAFMEPRFGHDFSHVQVHVDSRAAASTEAVGALAYTVGRDVVFGHGRYAPQTTEGRRLLAHELTHVIQQTSLSGSSGHDLTIGPLRDASETEATMAARRVEQTSSAGVVSPVTAFSSKPRIQRQPTFSPECNAFHRCSIIEPLVHSRQMVDAVLAELPAVAGSTVTSGRIIDLLNVHFHTSTVANAATILANFRSIRAELDAPIPYVCHTDEPAECEMTATGFVGGFTNCAPHADVHLCSMYYVGLPCTEQARVLVHEMAHHIPGLCSDHAYVAQGAYMTLPPDRAMENPDTYAQFASMVFLGAASCIDCGTEIQRRGGKRY